MSINEMKNEQYYCIDNYYFKNRLKCSETDNISKAIIVCLSDHIDKDFNFSIFLSKKILYQYFNINNA